MADHTPTAKQGGSAPSHVVYFAPARARAPWLRIGAQWPTKNGRGHRQVLEAVPLGQGRIIVLPYGERAPNTDEAAS